MATPSKPGSEKSLVQTVLTAFGHVLPPIAEAGPTDNNTQGAGAIRLVRSLRRETPETAG
jgi:hypothetical protein